MKRINRLVCFLPLILIVPVAHAKQNIQIEVVASRPVAHDSGDDLSRILQALRGPEEPANVAEIFNLDVIMNGEHVTLLCRDKNGCESLKPGKYEAVVSGQHRTDVVLKVPSTPKPVKRRYQIARNW